MCETVHLGVILFCLLQVYLVSLSQSNLRIVQFYPCGNITCSLVDTNVFFVCTYSNVSQKLQHCTLNHWPYKLLEYTNSWFEDGTIMFLSPLSGSVAGETTLVRRLSGCIFFICACIDFIWKGKTKVHSANDGVGDELSVSRSMRAIMLYVIGPVFQ